MSFIAKRPKVCRRLFPRRTYNPKTLFYLAYKTARLNCVDMSELPLTIRNQQKEVDNYILKCDEDINNVIGTEHLNNFDFSKGSRLEIYMYLAIQNIKEIPDWLDETMWVQKHYYVNNSQQYEECEMSGLILKTSNVKQCVECFEESCKLAEHDVLSHRISGLLFKNKTAYDANDILNLLQDGGMYCETCITTPLFSIHRIEYY
ncbi:NS3 protein [Ambidensovirus sp.]|uniref:NS3 protein n=1 Tax=Ambidensovirus sp. TaxID=2050976 RepID=A0ABX6IS19_9VIRU|nr:NS3 protein [Ambidensovirus sp.]